MLNAKAKTAGDETEMKERTAMAVSNAANSTLLTVTMIEATNHKAEIQKEANQYSVDDEHTMLRFSLMPTPVRPLPTGSDLTNPKISPAYGARTLPMSSLLLVSSLTNHKSMRS